MRRFFSLIFLLVMCASMVYGQSDSLRIFKADSGLVQDKKVNQLVLKHVQINEKKNGKISGYRVQIHFSAEKAKALEVKSKFITSYSTIPAYLDYYQPYFKIRVGDFRTKLEAYNLLQRISGEFPGAFIVQDEIEMPPL